jgi:lipopolysaccharide export LptBFGC system permease protein LptF
MAIGSYPRVTVQGTGATNNIQNGLGLMVLNPSTGKYEAATAATFAGGGGGGDATAANQTTQINEAQTSNNYLSDVSTYTNLMQSYNIAYGKPTAEYLNDIALTLIDIKNLLTDIKNNQTNATQKTQVVSSTGTSANVNESNALVVTNL